MGKIEVSALIKAIQESVSLLVSDGIAPRERITDPVNDAARVQDLESGYSTEIDDIVDNIPDVPPTPPAPTLPTVALSTYYTGNYVTNCSPGNFLNLYENAKLVPYDSTKTHIARVSDGHGGWNEWQFSCIEYAGDLAIKNMTSDKLSTYSVRLFSCSSTQAEIIYVYNSSNEKYQAFKFTLDGTYYYYVADSVQNDWTDDLSSIGYSLEPTVLYAYPQSGGEAGLANSSWSKGSYYTVYNPNGDYISPSPSYTITAVYYISNNVLTKYDNEYAFKFNFRYSASYLQARQNNSTSYNVAKIEYKDLPTEKAYLNQTSHSSNWDFPYNTNTLLYADDGSYIPYDTSKRYVMTCASKKDGTLVAAELTPVNMDGYLGYRVSTTAQACFIYYTMS